MTSTQTQFRVLTSLKRILVLLITGIFDCNGLVQIIRHRHKSTEDFFPQSGERKIHAKVDWNLYLSQSFTHCISKLEFHSKSEIIDIRVESINWSRSSINPNQEHTQITIHEYLCRFHWVLLKMWFLTLDGRLTCSPM